MTIQQLKYVLAVADLKNFEAAADKCFVTQSTLSTMIKRLENEIEVSIFNRKTKPVSITPEGNQIIEKMRVVVREMDSLNNHIQEIKGEYVGDLKIGVIPTIAPYLMPLFMNDFALSHPRINLSVKEMTTDQIKKALKLRLLDIGILALPLEDSELVEHPIYEEPFMVYDCREDKENASVSVNNIDFENLWLLQDGHCMRAQVIQICELYHKKKPQQNNFVFESGSMDSLLRFTKSSKGMTIIPFLAAVDMDVDSNCYVVDFTEPKPARTVGLITHKSFLKKKMLMELEWVIAKAVQPLLLDVENVRVLNPY